MGALLSDYVNLAPVLVIVRKVIILKDCSASIFGSISPRREGIHINPQCHVFIFVNAV